MKMMKSLATLLALLTAIAGGNLRAADWAVYPAKPGPGAGKRIVFVTGDEKYGSEEGGQRLAKILAVRHGSNSTLFFSQTPADGTIDPLNQTNIAGLQTLRDADMMVLF